MKKVSLNVGAKVNIGRNEKNDLCIKDKKASSNHAVIFYTQDGAFINDIGSTNGTTVNGKKITSSVLKDNDKIFIGNTEIVYAEGKLFIDDSKVTVSINQAIVKPALSVQNKQAKQKKPNPFKAYFSNLKQKRSYEKQAKPDNGVQSKSPRVFFSKKLMAIVASSLVVVLLFVILIPNMNQAKKAVKEDFVPLIETPSLTEMALSNTFYYVPLDIPGNKAQKQSKYMQTLAADAVDAADKLMDGFYTTRKEIDTAYELLSDLMVTCDVNAGTRYLSKKEIFAETNRLHANFEVAQVGYEAMEVMDYGDIFVNTDVISRKMLYAIAAGDNAASAFTLLAYVSAAVIEENKSSSDKQIQNKIKKLDNFFEKTKAYENIEKMSICTDVINHIALYAEVGKAEVVQENIAYARQVIPQMDANIAAAKASNAFTEEQKLALEYAGIACKEMIDVAEYEVNQYLSNVELLYNSSQYYVFDNALITYASAGWSLFGTSEKANDAIRENSSNSSSKSMWQWVKDTSSSAMTTAGNVVGTAVDGAIYVAGEARNTVGYVVDQYGNMVYSGTVALSTLDTGLSASDSYELIADEQERQWDNFQKGESGETFAHLQEGVNDVVLVTQYGLEEAAELVENETVDAVRRVTGLDISAIKGKLSGTANFLGGVATGTILGLTSGIANVLSPKSTASDVAMGFVDLLFSFVGGSSNIFKPSTAGKAAIAAGKEMGEKGVKEGLKTASKSMPNAIKKFAKSPIKNTKAGLNKLNGNFTDSFKENTQKHIFTANGSKVIKNVDELVENGDESFFWELFDHLGGSYIDDKAKVAVGEAFKEDEELAKEEATEEPNVISKYIDKTQDGMIENKEGQRIDYSNILDFDIHYDGTFVHETMEALSKVNTDGAINWLFGDDMPEEEIIYEVSEEGVFDEVWDPSDGVGGEIDEEEISDGEQEVDEQAIEDWVNEPNKNIQRPDGAKYQWVLDRVDNTHPDDYVKQYHEKNEYRYSFYEYGNGSKKGTHTYYPTSENDEIEIVIWADKWSPIRDSYYEGETVYGRWSFIPSASHELGSGVKNNTIYIWIGEDNWSTEPVVWMENVLTSTPVTREYSFNIPEVKRKSDVLVIVDMNTSYFYYKAERIR